MNDSTYFDRNDTGILSLADLFRQDRLPCRAEPKGWLPSGVAPEPEARGRGPADMAACEPAD
jgi:hypothetical protein